MSNNLKILQVSIFLFSFITGVLLFADSGSNKKITFARKVLPCSEIKTKEGKIIKIYPNSLLELKENEEIDFKYSYSTYRIIVAFPPKTSEEIREKNIFHLPTESGEEIEIEHRWYYGNEDGSFFKGPKKMPVSDKDEFTKSYTIKTVSGPKLKLELVFRTINGETYCSGYENWNFIKPLPQKPKDERVILEHDGTLVSLFQLIAESTDDQTRLNIEKEIYDLRGTFKTGLKKYLNSDNSKVRESAVALVRWIPENDITIKEIVPLLDDKSIRVKKEARYTLNYLILLNGKSSQINKEPDLIDKTLKVFIKDLVANPHYLRFAMDAEPRRSVLTTREIGIFPLSIKKLPEKIDIKTYIKKNMSLSDHRKLKDLITFSYMSPEKPFYTPAILFHRIKVLDNYVRISFTPFFGGKYLNSRSQFWNMNFTAIFLWEDASWKLISFSPYSLDDDTWANYSNMNPLLWRNFDNITPVNYERFVNNSERIKLYDILNQNLEGSPEFLFKYVNLEDKKTLPLLHSRSPVEIDEKCVELLWKNVEDTSPKLRAAVILALSELKQKKILPMLINTYLTDKDKYIKESCENYIFQTIISKDIPKKVRPKVINLINEFIEKEKIDKNMVKHIELRYSEGYVVAFLDMERKDIAILITSSDKEWKIIKVWKNYTRGIICN